MRCRGLTYEINQIYKLYSILFYPRRRVARAHVDSNTANTYEHAACRQFLSPLSLVSGEWTGECLESAHVVPTGSPLVGR